MGKKIQQTEKTICCSLRDATELNDAFAALQWLSWILTTCTAFCPAAWSHPVFCFLAPFPSLLLRDRQGRFPEKGQGRWCWSFGVSPPKMIRLGGKIPVWENILNHCNRIADQPRTPSQLNPRLGGPGWWSSQQPFTLIPYVIFNTVLSRPLFHLLLLLTKGAKWERIVTSGFREVLWPAHD